MLIGLPLARLSDIDLTAVEASIASLGIQVSTNTGNISTLTTQVNTNTSNIATNTTNISNLTITVNANTTSIGGLTTTTNTHTTQIAALQALITALQTRACGAMYISATSATTGASSYVKAEGTTTAGNILVDFTHTNNRLTYTGTTTKKFRVNLDGKVSGGVAATVSVAVYKIVTSPASQTLVRSEDTTTIALVSEGSFGVNCLVSLAQNEAIEIWIKTTGVGGSVTLRTSTLTITEV